MKGHLADLAALTKPGITAMVVGSALAGYALAGPAGRGSAPLLLAALLGTLLASAGAAAWNMALEVEVDARMERTRRRPLPSGRLGRGEAALFGALLVASGILLLALAVNHASALVAASTVALYVGLYTPLKRSSVWNTLVGAAAGAMPPLIGGAARGGLGAGPWVLFLILFFWQMPHFYALAWIYRRDYDRAGLRMLPVEDPTGGRTALQVGIFTLLLFGASLLPLALPGIEPFPYGVGAALAGGAFALPVLGFVRRPAVQSARPLFLASLGYLPILFALLVASKVWV